MSSPALLTLFDRVADPVGSVEKLRAAILDLAVRGKLVERRVDDGTAAEILVEIQSEHDRLVKEGTFKKPKTLPPVEADAPDFAVPDGWEWVRLGRLGMTNIGLTYSPKDVGESGIPVLRANNIRDGRLNFDELVRVNTEVKPSAIAHEGDLLICARSGSRRLVGKAAIAGSLPEPMAFGAFMAIFRSPINSYIHIFLCSPLFRNLIDEVNTTTINQLTQGNLRSTLIPLPPLAEQKRIVAKVEELMGLCDELEAAQAERERQRERLNASSLHRIATAPDDDALRTAARFHFQILPRVTVRPDQIAPLRQTILDLAVRGKLVEQDEGEGDGSDLLARSNISPQNLSALELIPGSWEWCRLDSLVTVMDSGWSPACDDGVRQDKNQWAVLKTTAVQSLRYDQMAHKILPSRLEPRPKHEVQAGDLLITRAGPMNRVGISCLVEETESRLMLSDKIIRFHLKNGFVPQFYIICLNAGITASTIEGLKSGMAKSQVNISQSKLRSVGVPVPPTNEQRRIVAKVDELMALCDELETSLTRTQNESRRLLDAVMAEIGSGQEN